MPEKKIRINTSNVFIEYPVKDLDYKSVLDFLQKKLPSLYQYIILQTDEKTVFYIKLSSKMDTSNENYFNFQGIKAFARSLGKQPTEVLYKFIDEFITPKKYSFIISSNLQNFVHSYIELQFSKTEEFNKEEQIIKYNQTSFNEVDETREDLKLKIAKHLELPKQDKFVSSLFESLFLKYENIISILDQPDITATEKQFALENRQFLFLKSYNGLSFTISKKMRTLIKIIDHSVSSEDPLFFRDAPFLSSLNDASTRILKKANSNKISLQREANKPSTDKFQYLIKLTVLFKTFLCGSVKSSLGVDSNYSFGLLCIHRLSVHLLHHISQEHNPKAVFYKLNTDQNLTLNETFEAFKEQTFFHRTVLKESLVDTILSSYISLYSFIMYQSSSTKTNFLEAQTSLISNIKLYINQNPDYSTEERQSILAFIDVELVQKNFRVQFSKTERQNFSNLVFGIFETLGLISFENKDGFGKDSKKTTTYFILSEEYKKDLLDFHINFSNLPQLIEPTPWELDNANKNIKDGGYMMNKTANAPGIKFHTSTSYATSLTDDELDAINYLQKVSYKINSPFLEHVISNLSDCWLTYLTSDENKLPQNPFYERNGQAIRIYSFSEFYSKSSFKKEAALMSPENKADRLKVSYRYEYYNNLAHDEYNRIIQSLHNFLDILITAVAFSKNTFYFSWFYDFRMRIYPQTGLLSPQGSNFARNLLEFVVDEKLAKESLLVEGAYKRRQIEAWLAEKGSKSFSAISHNFKTKSMVICDFDVSSSGFQIYSGLLGFGLGLFLTNYVQKCDDVSLGKKNDLYESFNQKLVAELQKLDFSEEAKKDSKWFHFISDLIALKDILIKEVCKRSFIKGLLICYLYSEGNKSRIDKILEKLRINIDSNMYLEIGDKYRAHFPVQSEHKFMFDLKYFIATKMNSAFLKIFKENFTDIFSTKTFLEKTLVKSQRILELNGIALKISKNSSYIFYNVYGETAKRYAYMSSRDGKKHHYILTESTDRFDVKKASSGIGPNFIHRIDSAVMLRLILKAKKLEIPLCCTHDCVQTLINFEKDVKQLYFDSFKEIVLELDPLESFIESNSNSDELKKHISALVDYKENKALVLSRIKSNHLVPSEFILNP